MSQQPWHPSLRARGAGTLVREPEFRLAEPHEVLKSAHQLISRQFRPGADVLQDPKRVREFLRLHVDINVIGGWLGHVSLNTTHRYAEITMRMKTEAMKICAPRSSAHSVPWNDDPSLLTWLSSL